MMHTKEDILQLKVTQKDLFPSLHSLSLKQASKKPLLQILKDKTILWE